jgi:NAD(P)-dependent dehydrogenase (short-subunit alcohol dehydrogenase family)
MNVVDLFRLDGRVAVVTGGAGILGAHISSALAEAGAQVVIASKSPDRPERLARDLGEAGLAAVAAPLDLASEASVTGLCRFVVSRFGKVDILFNNAVARSGGDIGTATGDDWRRAMDVNATGLFFSCKTFGEQMARQRSGVIVNVASIYGTVGPDFSIYEGTGLTNPVNYAFAKGGMISLTRYLASYYGPFGVRVNSISPGGFATDGMPDQFVSRYSRKTPLGRMARGDDIKGPALFLASDASAYMTGQNVLVDGGWTAL